MAATQHTLGNRFRAPQQHRQGGGTALDGVGKVRFLLEMSARLEADGNMPEAIQSAESALLLRRELDDEDQSLFPQSLQTQAQDLVKKCNALGVAAFQRDMFDAASFLLEKALLLTDENPTMHTFLNHEHDRLRLRAATFNNIGCMEKRRSNYPVALKNLQQAVELETLVDPDVGAGPSTYLNLCTILNKMGDFTQAINAADRALRAAVLQQQQGRELNPAFVHLIVMAHYNRGVALEFAGRPGDVAKAHDSYMQAVRTADRFGPRNMSAGSESVKEAAIAAIRRLDQQPALAFGLDGRATGSGAASPLSASLQSGGGGVRGPMDLATARLLAQLQPLPPPGSIPVVTAASAEQSAIAAAASSSSATAAAAAAGGGGHHHQPPSSAPLPGGKLPIGGLILDSGAAAAAAAANRTGVNKRFAGNMTAQRRAGPSAAGVHRTRSGRKEEYDARLQNAVKKAKAAHQKERADKTRKEQEAAVKKREEEAFAKFRRTEATLRNDRIAKLHQSAIKIQRRWRGYYARDMIMAMANAALKIQSVVRSHRCRVMLKSQAQAKQEADRMMLMHQQKVQACTLIMRPVRRFLRICDTWRKLHALRLQRFHSARKIQRAWRDYRVRCDEEFVNRIASEKKAHEEKQRRHNLAAKRIQLMFRSWKSKKLMRIVRAEQGRRNEAATTIQALIRGTLTRVWYKHFIVYRRQQMLSTASSLRKIVKIQAHWRGAVVRRRYRRMVTERRIKDRETKKFVSARRIQCFYRCYVARTRFAALKYRAQRRHAAATKIEAVFRGHVARKCYRIVYEQERRLRAARVIQSWYRTMRLRRKNVREARWAAERRAEEKRLLRRTGNAMCIQTWARWALARVAYTAVLERYKFRAQHARLIQRVGRGRLGRKDVATTKRIAWMVDQNEKKFQERSAAARVIQRNVRSHLAKSTLTRLRREFASSCIAQAFCRGRRSWTFVLHTMRVNRLNQAVAAARKIQKATRLWIQRKHLLELEKYYLMVRRNKLLQMRKEEAATQIQSIVRGHTDRKLAKREKQRSLQRMIDCVTIQRWFRRRAFRRSINAEFEQRRIIRAQRTQAAIKLQSFWRRILAEEYVAVIRERRYYKTVAAIVLQCWYRCVRAKRIARRKREARAKYQALCQEKQVALDYAVKLVTAFLRTRYNGWSSLAGRESQLAGQLERRVMSLYLLRNAAATKIQAAYRGASERVYVRGLRAERKARQKIEENIHAKQTRAACRIQRAARSWLARRTFQRLLHERRERELAIRMEYEEKADPQNLVKQLFWVQEALTHRALGQERKRRHGTAHSAAVRIQAAARGFLIRLRKARLLFEKREETLAIIGDSRDLSEQEALALKVAQEEAATKIQKVVRGFVERRRWADYRRNLTEQREDKTMVIERRDAAAIRIQAVRRGYVARVFTTRLWMELEAAKELQRRHVAARMIQRNFCQHRERMRRRKPKLVSGQSPSAASPHVRSGHLGTIESRATVADMARSPPLHSKPLSPRDSDDAFNSQLLPPAAVPIPPPRRTSTGLMSDSTAVAAAAAAAAAASSTSAVLPNSQLIAPAPPRGPREFTRNNRSKPMS